MRVISGKYKGHRLFVPKGLRIRPTSDLVKEAIFDMLNLDWNGRYVLDLFAGTGGLGIEALSRGADKVVFVDNSIRAIKSIEKNLSSLGISSAVIIRRDITKGLNFLRKWGPFDVVFMDPPYREGLIERALKLLEKTSNILNSQSILVIEHYFKQRFLTGPFLVQKRKEYGQTAITLLRLGENYAREDCRLCRFI